MKGNNNHVVVHGEMMISPKKNKKLNETKES